jgi:hypothetical protein
MKTWDIVVIGGGAAGSMAAITAGRLGKKVLLIERNDSIGRKILITGKGRCNITNSADISTFIEKFGKQGEFLRTAFYAFSSEDLVAFLNELGLETKIERQGRIFPVTDKAHSVVDALKKALSEASVEVIYNGRICEIARDGESFKLVTEGEREIGAKKVIIATGGASYRVTGSTGDGFTMAEKLGHSVAVLTPGLVPLTVKEGWVKELQGIALENISIKFDTSAYGKKSLTSDVGELMFTHFGVSGPLVLDMSAKVMDILKEYKEISLLIDFKPGLRVEQLESKLLHKFKIKGNVVIKNLLRDLLPQRLIDRFLRNLKMRDDLKTNQITLEQRSAIIAQLKAFKLTITGSLPIEEAMVTGGGVSIKEINPRTMESKVVSGIYFAGEVIEGSAASGGYNLQQAFSTGYLAGEKAAQCVQ